VKILSTRTASRQFDAYELKRIDVHPVAFHRGQPETDDRAVDARCGHGLLRMCLKTLQNPSTRIPCRVTSEGSEIFRIDTRRCFVSLNIINAIANSHVLHEKNVRTCTGSHEKTEACAQTGTVIAQRVGSMPDRTSVPLLPVHPRLRTLSRGMSHGETVYITHYHSV
jgi:hypothetical protein